MTVEQFAQAVAPMVGRSWPPIEVVMVGVKKEVEAQALRKGLGLEG